MKCSVLITVNFLLALIQAWKQWKSDEDNLTMSILKWQSDKNNSKIVQIWPFSDHDKKKWWHRRLWSVIYSSPTKKRLGLWKSLETVLYSQLMCLVCKKIFCFVVEERLGCSAASFDRVPRQDWTWASPGFHHSFCKYGVFTH